ncbi:MAG: tetratricopeptide repeat protein [Bacteroidaceae bacterium]|nr:tetratricopeptide repeat protein [Bacteroidaceae bacterium]
MAKETKKQEELVNVEEVVNKSEAFLTKNKNTIVGGIVAVVVVIAAVFCYNNYVKAPRELKASEALFQAEQYFRNGNFEQALNGDSLGAVGFVTVAEEYSGTEAGNLANAYAGMALAQLKKYEEALKYLNDFSGDDAMVAPAALGTMGNCYAQLGQNDKAASVLMKAASMSDSHSLSPIYLLQAGQIYEELGQNDKAVEAYKQIKNKYFNSMQAYDIDKYIERASMK